MTNSAVVGEPKEEYVFSALGTPGQDFADGADAEGIAQLAENPIIKGFTTKPTLMRAAGVADYEHFARGVLGCVGRRPDPVPLMRAALDVLAPHAQIELIWASPREILNVVQSDAIGCRVITVTHDLLRKPPLIGRRLEDVSLDTVQMFHRDALTAGYTL